MSSKLEVDATAATSGASLDHFKHLATFFVSVGTCVVAFFVLRNRSKSIPFLKMEHGNQTNEKDMNVQHKPPLSISNSSSLPSSSSSSNLESTSTKSNPQPITPSTTTTATTTTTQNPVQSNKSASSKYFTMILLGPLPSKAQTQDSSRITALYFAVQALSMLASLPKALAAVVPRQKDPIQGQLAIVNWIYSLQCQGGGFVGSPAEPIKQRNGHVVATYSALATLCTLGDSLKQVNRQTLYQWLASLQDPATGCFRATTDPSESDLRFTYAAIASLRFLGCEPSTVVNRKAVLKYCEACRNPDGGYGLTPGAESHGGATYTAVATQFLLNCPLQQENTIETARFCSELQSAVGGGFHGRPGKASDVCYGFWVGATLCMLGLEKLIDRRSLQTFVASSATPIGGFAKVPGEHPDPLHAMFGVWCEERLCMDSQVQITPTSAALGVTASVAERF